MLKQQQAPRVMANMLCKQRWLKLSLFWFPFKPAGANLLMFF
jgi:hypothetical protein